MQLVKNVYLIFINLVLGMSGEMMFQCCCDFIRNCSASKIEVSAECIGNTNRLNFQTDKLPLIFRPFQTLGSL